MTTPEPPAASEQYYRDRDSQTPEGFTRHGVKCYDRTGGENCENHPYSHTHAPAASDITLADMEPNSPFEDDPLGVTATPEQAAHPSVEAAIAAAWNIHMQGPPGSLMPALEAIATAARQVRVEGSAYKWITDNVQRVEFQDRDRGSLDLLNWASSIDAELEAVKAERENYVERNRRLHATCDALEADNQRLREALKVANDSTAALRDQLYPTPPDARATLQPETADGVDSPQ